MRKIDILDNDKEADDEEADRGLQQTLVDYILAGGQKSQNVLCLATFIQLGLKKEILYKI